jgi:comEA protein
MNAKERAVLVFLIVMILAGAGASAWRHYRLQRNLKAVRIEILKDSTARSDSAARNSPSAIASPQPAVLVELNSATAVELDLLPGIGPVLAQRIIEYRSKHGTFKAIEELKQVSGIGPKKFEAIKDHVTVNR